MPTATTIHRLVEIDIAEERCDRCGQRAFVVTESMADDGRLLSLSWCAHHFNTLQPQLHGAHVILDERQRIK